MNLVLPLYSSSPNELMEKPVVGEAPVSHWNWVVGAGTVRQQDNLFIKHSTESYESGYIHGRGRP
jgi:hypothetical protein